MKRLAIPLLAIALAAPAFAQSVDPKITAMRDAALKDDTAWNIVEGLTTEVGPRLAATEQEARARTWGAAKLKALGFQNVRIETYQMPVWLRGQETAEIIAPFPQKLTLTALGNSGATPPDGLTAQLVVFADFSALKAAPDGSLTGKIVYVGNAMQPTQDGSSYGAVGGVRFGGPAIAAKKGAAAIIIRSIGTDHNRIPHTGMTTWPEGVSPIAAAALSVPDAEQIERIAARGKPISLKLLLTPHRAGMAESGNVIAEVPGTDPAAGIVLVGGHLDSWDLGTGAIDDGAGLAITTAAAHAFLTGPRPRRTIRVVWFGAEEVGGYGGRDYAAKHGGERHVSATESDFGADRIWRFQASFADVNKPLVDRVGAALAPLGISHAPGMGDGGADVDATRKLGAGGIDLGQDGTRYFDVHHTPDDTLDRIDPVQLRQNVAAWTAVIGTIANAPEDIAPFTAKTGN